jgi:hypothetical protein
MGSDDSELDREFPGFEAGWNPSVIFALPIVVIFATVYGCYTLVPYKWKVTCNSHGCYTSSVKSPNFVTLLV